MPRMLALLSLVVLALLPMHSSGAQTPAPSHRVAVAAHALPRGTVLVADDFQYRDTTARYAAPADTTVVTAGWITRRMIAAGEVLRAPAVEAPAAVSANQPVEVEWQDQNVRLTIRGIAMRRGSLGERVSVRTELGRRMDATVVAPGRVRIE